MSEDPIGFNGGINFYAYVDNSPLNYRDPFGLQKKPQKFHDNVVLLGGAAAGALILVF